MLTGLGAASADAVYGYVAGFGLVFISNILVSQQIWLKIVGGLFLCLLGFKTLLSRPVAHVASTRRYGHAEAYASTFFLTLTNPMTILSFAGVFAGLGLGGGNYISAGLLVLGVFSGSVAWWLFLSSAVSVFRNGFDSRRMQWVNRASGIIMLAFGVVAIVGLISSR
jgi:threonine/homoserine/homoserine lactone efflux protein